MSELNVPRRASHGPATLAALRAIDPTVRCCFVTGDPNLTADLLALGAVAVFVKPFRLTELATAVAQIVGRRG